MNEQASMAESRGAAGVIFYTDPADYAVMGTESVYPDTVMMPPTGVQLGTVKLTDGDPLTPFYPSIGIFIGYSLLDMSYD